jgi:hypothetical protein
MNLSTMKLRDLKAILKQFKSGYVGMGLKDLFLMQQIEDEIYNREYLK